MKKLLFIILSFILAFTLYAQTIVLQTNRNGIRKSNDQFSGFQASFSYDKIESTFITGTERGTFSALSIGGAYPSGELGTPQLPVFKKMIAIPVDATPRVVVKNFTTSEYNLDEYGFNKLYPAQPSVRRDQNSSDIHFYYDEKTYSSNEYIFSSLADVEVLGDMRGVNLGMIAIHPIQYNPVENSILVFNDIEIEVVFDNANYQKTEDLFVNSFSPYFVKHYNLVFNQGVTRDLFDDNPDLYKTPVHMLVIANRMFEATLQPWIEWKTKKGFYMDVNYTDVIGNTAAAITTFCHNKYNQGITNGTAPTFIVIVGDTPQVPPSDPGTGANTSRATDLFYGRVSGAYIPQMYYSRMSAQTTQQLQNIIEKILYYEKYQFADPTYLDNVLLIAGADATWNPTVAQPTINYAANNYFNSAHGYTNVYKYLDSYSGCYANLNNVGFANYTAHCGETEWSTPNFPISQVSTLTNMNKYFIAMGNCCLAADFGYGECIGEAMIRAPQKGAVGYIGSSTLSYWHDDFHFGVGAYQGSWNPANPNSSNTKEGCYDFMFHDADFNSLSSYVYGANLSVTYAMTTPGYTTDQTPLYYWRAYNVLGDGSLMPYNTQADVNDVSHLPVIYIGLDTYEVTADPGSYVAISKDGVLLGVAVADASGLAQVQITPLTSGGNVDIVVTRNQRQPYITQVPAVAQEGPYVVPSGYTVVGEDNLTYISTNKDIEVTLKNVGVVTTVGNINVTIACDDPQITFNTSTATCGSIAPDGTATVTFNVTVNNAILNGKSFITTLTVTDGSKQEWVSKLSLKAFAPVFSLKKVLIDGVEGGNLPKGALVKITTVIENKGGADAYNVIGSLDIASEFIMLACDNEKRSGKDLPAGESLEFDFFVITDANIPSGYETNINFALSAAYNRSYETQFTVANSGTNSYCMPGSSNCSGYDDRITSLIIVKKSDQSVLLNNPNPICSSNGYTDYTNVLLYFIPGEEYTIKVKTGYQNHRVRGWIDLNGNNIFENNESMFIISCANVGTEYSQDFTIPQDFAPGDQRFRIRTRDGSTTPEPCNTYSYGQTLDYTAVFPELYPRVQSVFAELQGKDIMITWEAPAEETPIGYNIYRNGNKLNTTGLIADLNFTEYDLPEGVYAYNVKAVYTGNKESFAEMSNVICFFLACEKPVNLEVTLESKTATLAWEDSDGMEGTLLGYNVYCNETKINNELVTEKEYLVENLIPGKYCYQVSSVYEHCPESELTEEFCITLDPEFCEPPVNVMLINDEISILITWDAPENIDGILLGYNVYLNDNKINEEIIEEREYRAEITETGSYQVSAVYEHCESELSETVGVKEHIQSCYNIFPNPTTGEFRITNYELQISSIEIFDVLGKKVFKQETQNSKPEININLSHLQSGVYFVKIYTEENHFAVKRLVIMK